jgi:hypothetical protein
MKLMTTILCVLCTCYSGGAFGEEPQRSLVGAIRWDAWHGDAGLAGGPQTFKTGKAGLTPGLAVERSLGPKHWHYRLPFYAKVISDDKVEIRANSQEVMDKEIAYAADAGLDYWAFLTYPPGSPMTLGLDLYLSSKDKAKIKFSVILHHIRRDALNEEVKRIAGYLKDPQYQKVLNGRPLVYAFQFAAGKEFYDALVAAAAADGLPRPYFVNMGNNSGEVAFNATSSYLGKAGGWKSQAGVKLIPDVGTGWDRRPRVENPVPWEGGTPQPLADRSPNEAEPEIIAARVAAAMEWNAKNPVAGEANAVIIYAWNEFDEGGWLCPTLAEGTARLDAIRKVLKSGGKNTIQPSAAGAR